MAGKDPEKAKRNSPAGVYEHWQAEMPAEFEVTAEDAAYATLTFESGAVCQYLEEHATFGKGFWHRGIYGSAGSMELPGDRSGQPLTIGRDGETLQGEGLLDLVPDFAPGRSDGGTLRRRPPLELRFSVSGDRPQDHRHRVRRFRGGHR